MEIKENLVEEFAKRHNLDKEELLDEVKELIKSKAGMLSTKGALKILEKKKYLETMDVEEKTKKEFQPGKPVETTSVKYRDPDGTIYVINLNLWPSGGISINKSKATDEGFKEMPVSLPQSRVPEIILALQKLWIKRED